MNEEIKNKLQRGLALTVKESWDLYKYIEALEQTMWIPVSERLPEVGQRVLATDKFEAVTTAIYFKKSPFWREMIVAWMPLPKPYKESEEQ